MLLVTGAGGQVGRALCRQAAAGGVACAGLTHGMLDIADRAAVASRFHEVRPRVVINCAAWTDVDGAERHPADTLAANRDGPATLAAACAAAGVPLLHLSTDHVFDGRGDRPWREEDAVAPLGEYGRSKAAGEAGIRRCLDRHLILRTSWVFSAHGRNFVTAILAQARAGGELAVVGDTVGAPTPATDLASALLALAQRCRAGDDLAWGTYHLAGRPFVSRHGFAAAIVEGALARGLLTAPPALRDITAAEWPGSALRPANARLDSGHAARALGLAAPDWREGLARVLDDLAAGAGT